MHARLVHPSRLRHPSSTTSNKHSVATHLIAIGTHVTRAHVFGTRHTVTSSASSSPPHFSIIVIDSSLVPIHLFLNAWIITQKTHVGKLAGYWIHPAFRSSTLDVSSLPSVTLPPASRVERRAASLRTGAVPDSAGAVLVLLPARMPGHHDGAVALTAPAFHRLYTGFAGVGRRVPPAGWFAGVIRFSPTCRSL